MSYPGSCPKQWLQNSDALQTPRRCLLREPLQRLVSKYHGSLQPRVRAGHVRRFETAKCYIAQPTSYVGQRGAMAAARLGTLPVLEATQLHAAHRLHVTHPSAPAQVQAQPVLDDWTAGAMPRGAHDRTHRPVAHVRVRIMVRTPGSLLIRNRQRVFPPLESIAHRDPTEIARERLQTSGGPLRRRELWRRTLRGRCPVREKLAGRNAGKVREVSVVIDVWSDALRTCVVDMKRCAQWVVRVSRVALKQRTTLHW
ncbi:hypothetical protein PYCCODRAFT_958878 [Trametes coccinea BRFM310]|uniref:Uncharacterized protein n=1 Tax=Trametes coccinea (strain BRFM310) TaxID=1353009 RepID=A0A1Y2IZZ4_TRAC3|nr:hypothetical protein PYCCODRAFT_958878 [Trametes coccinea BRFM310]